MEVTLSDDQEFFRDPTRKFLESECPIGKVRELASSDAGFERDYWRGAAADRVETALAKVIAENKDVTYDLKPDRTGGVSTSKMADAIIRAME